MGPELVGDSQSPCPVPWSAECMVWNAGSGVEVSRNSATLGQEAGWAGHGEVRVVPRVNGARRGQSAGSCIVFPMGSCVVPAWKQDFCNHLAVFLLCSLGCASRDGGREPEIAPQVQGQRSL